MAFAESVPHHMGSNLEFEVEDKLDEDILRVRTEIQALTKRRNLLSASLLSSSKIQSALESSKHNSNTDPVSTLEKHPLLLSQLKHNQSNIHRLALGITAFPFHDPNPEITTNPLLGIRFDIPSRSGRFERAPYYIFCKKTTTQRLTSPTVTLTIHHHTVPALVPLQAYETKYLPQQPPDQEATRHESDEGYYGSTSPSSTSHQIPSPSPPKQDLHALVAAVRNDLTSWVQRQEAIGYIADTLEIPASKAVNIHDDDDPDDEQPRGKFGVSLFGATGTDARFIRLVWTDGRVGRLKLSDDGFVTKAAVFSDTQLKDVERLLSTDKDGGQLSIMKLMDRLEEVEKRAEAARAVQRDDVEVQSQDGGHDHDIEMNDED